MEKDQIREAVVDQYGAVARGDSQGCCAPSCCQPSSAAVFDSLKIGYTEEQLAAIPEGANLGLGCGNPSAFASMRPGETVLDLGSGAGIDAFLAAKAVGPTGKVIGVDMTPDMIRKARGNAREAGFENVDFRLGEIENLPVGDASVDVITSNCVVNLSPDKPRVFAEAYRVLKPGGRLAISDVLAEGEMPAAIRASVEAVVGCIAGAATVDATVMMLKAAGFGRVEVTREEQSKDFIREWLPGSGAEKYVVSAKIQAVKE